MPMGASDNIREFFGFSLTKSTLADQKLERAEIMATEAQTFIREGMMTMLSIALEDRGWIQSDGFDRQKNTNVLSFKALQAAARNGRALISGNPIMVTAAQAKMALVLAKKVVFKGTGNLLKSQRNRRALFSKTAMLEIMRSKIAEGNIFLELNPQTKTIDRIPFWEIQGANYDSQHPDTIKHFYRTWQEVVTDFETGHERTITHKRFYKNTTYDLGGLPDAETITGIEVEQISEIYHIAPNRLVGQAWGYPDLLAGIFYASEHKELIEAADSIYRAQSQYAISYKTKTRKALESVAAQIAGPAPIDPRTGQTAEYGQSIAFGDDIEMQLMTKIGTGIDFGNFDAIAALASSVLGVPVAVVLGQEEPGKELPATTLRLMQNEQDFWDEVLHDVLEFFGQAKAKTYWPPIDPDATHRQIQSIVGIAATKVISPEETRNLARETFGADWSEKMPDPSEWEPFAKAPVTTAAPGSTEPKGGAITPGQGQSGQLGKLADGDHSLRDEGDQDHTRS